LKFRVDPHGLQLRSTNRVEVATGCQIDCITDRWQLASPRIKPPRIRPGDIEDLLLVLPVLEPDFDDLGPVEIAAIRIFDHIDSKMRRRRGMSARGKVAAHWDALGIGLPDPLLLFQQSRLEVPVPEKTDLDTRARRPEGFLTPQRVIDTFTRIAL